MPIDRWRRSASVSVALLAGLLGRAIGSAGAGTGTAKRSTGQPVDMRLLEFLGSADPTTDEKRADGGSWMVYLSKLKLGQAAKTAVPARPAPKPATASGSPGERSE